MSWVRNSRPPSKKRIDNRWSNGLCWGGGYREQGGFPPNLFPFEPNFVPMARWSWPQDGYPRGWSSARGQGLPWRPKPLKDWRPSPNFPFAPDFSRHARWEFRHRGIEPSAKGSGLPWYPRPRDSSTYRLPTIPTPALPGSGRVLSIMQGGLVDGPASPFEDSKRVTVHRSPSVWRYKYCQESKC